MPVFQRERLTRAEITVVRAVATLAGRRGAAVLVGGAVRDAWLGRRPGREVDLDVAVPAGALDLARRGTERRRRAFVPPHPQRGTGRAALGCRLTGGTVAAIRAVAPALAAVAAERVRDELLLMLALPDTARAFRRMDALGLLGVLLPEVEPMRATAQPAPHRFPVLEHSLRALASADRVLARLATLVPFGEELRAHMDEPLGGGVTRDPVLKLAALLHDVAKPETRRVVQGRVRFFGQDLLGGWQEQQAVEAAAPLLRGEDVMGRLGLAPGPAVGRALARVREAQALGRVKTREQALAYLDSLSADP